MATRKPATRLRVAGTDRVATSALFNSSIWESYMGTSPCYSALFNVGASGWLPASAGDFNSAPGIAVPASGQ